MKILAVDVSKDTLMPYDGAKGENVANTPSAISALLGAHPGYAVVCEATSTYHFELVNQAFCKGHRVYVVNPKEARNYKDSLSFRAKTDPLDARYLYEYVLRNEDLLRAFKPLSSEMRDLRAMLGERSMAVETRTALAMSFGKKKSVEQEKVLEALKALIDSLDKKLKALASKFESYEIFLGLPGVGPVIACVLVFIFESRDFESPEEVVAFLGLDIQVKQSGQYKGQGKLSKRGDPLLRYMMCIAGRCLLFTNLAKDKKAQLVAQNRHLPERMVIGARKLVRTAWTLHHRKEHFDQKKWKWVSKKVAFKG
jgi:transposase